MSLLEFIRLLVKHIRLLVIIPLIMAGTVYALVKDKPREYSSSTLLYTGFVSGYNIESGADSKLDYHVANSRFDNLVNLIKTKETYEEVAIRLMALLLSGELDRSAIPSQERPAIHISVLQDAIASLSESPDSINAYISYVRQQADSGNNVIYETIYSNKGPFSIKGLESNASVKRIGVSDLIQIDYTSHAPQLSQVTLELISDVSIERYKSLRFSEVGDVVAYFSKETDRHYSQLMEVIDEKRDFGIENRVINYYEQTKFIASQKELIDQQIQQEEMTLSAAQSSLKTLEEKIGMTSELLVMNARILEKRKELSTLTAQVTLNEANGQSSPVIDERILELRLELTTELRALHQLNHSREGMAKGELITQWLESLVGVNESQARLAVLKQRKSEYQKTYDEFAPLGSTLSTLEREVDISERGYLQMLHSLNMAKMRQQNIEMASDLAVIDAPYLPLRPRPSKAKLLVVFAYLAGTVMCLGGILAFELLDYTIKTPLRGAKLTGLKLAGAFPLAAKNKNDHTLHALNSRLSKQLACQVQLALQQTPLTNTSMPHRLIVCSGISEGSNTYPLIQGLKGALRANGYPVVHIAPKHEDQEEEKGTRFYDPRESLNSREFWQKVLPKPALSRMPKQTFILFETPSLTTTDIPIQLLGAAKLMLCVVRADRIWTDSNKMLVDTLKKAHKRDPLLVVSNVREDRIEQVVHEIPKKRSHLRVVLKRLINREFRS